MATPTPNNMSNGLDFPIGFTDTKARVPSVGVAASQVAAGNQNRLGLVFVNLSANNIFIHFEADVSSAKGVLLIPSGGSFKLARWEDFDFVGFPFYAVASGAASNLLVLEVFKSTFDK